MGSRTLARYFAGRFFVSVAAVFAGVFVLVLFVDYIDLMRRASDAPKAQASMLVLVSLFRVPQIMARLFPYVPADHPAMGAMIMNLAANMLGLGNAATPFGLKAMKELERLNPHPGVATNAMALFLSINTAGVAVLPLGVIAIRASLGSKNAAGIFMPSLLATMIHTTSAIIICKLIERSARFAPERYIEATPPTTVLNRG